jgi:ATP-dependent helicase/nuclease subunit A
LPFKSPLLTKTFSIYRSSAGSGKTRTLAKEYLKLALKYRADYFKYILAVTFTNKASQEMKDRILAYLDDFAHARPNELAEELQSELSLDAQTFQQHSQEAQAAVLHHYAQFSISTIDAFFQRVIRSFTRESGLVGDYRLEVEQDAVLEQVIDNLIDELGANKELTDWVVEFAKENLENERAWDVRYSLIEFAKEIFREEFKGIEDDLNRTTSQKGFFKTLKAELWKTKNYFISRVSKPALEALQMIEAQGWQPDDFKYGKNSGLFTFFKLFAYERNLSKLNAPGKRIRNEFTYPENWPNKNSAFANDIFRLASDKLVPRLAEVVAVYDELYPQAISAEVALKNLYVFGLIADISRKLKEYKDENNLMLLADAPKFLNGVIQDSDTPFVYEKVGSFYRNYLIDEFQDTSGMQWKNFQPLIVNSLDQGYSSLVVGDVKQAIYRWRGGDLNLLQQNIVSLIGAERVEVKELDRNFRSAFHVVNFNNALFKTASTIIGVETGATIPTEAYTDVAQKISKKEDGFVHVEFIQEPQQQKELGFQGGDDNEDGPAKWKEIALEKLPLFLEQLQEKGAALKDIAILVRKNDEGQRIATHLLQYKNSPQAKPGCLYDVVSNESLRIDGASSVNLLLGAMRYLFNPEDSIARAQLGYEFARIHEPSRELPDVFAVTNQAFFENNLPQAFTKEKPLLKKLSLIELTETLIEIFNLGNQVGELVYLQAFQDLVLDFYSRERNDLGAFLDWWEDNKHKKSIQISGEVNAVQILTVHKSKGLQFKYVIIPFCSWSLDHDTWQAPNLWVKTEHPPFRDAGYLPVKYGAVLENTYFSEYYREERTRSMLDNLNLLYVALTRAESGMIVTAPHISLRDVKKSVAGLLYNGIVTNETLKASWNESLLTWSTGEWSIGQSTSKPVTDAISLSHYYSTGWRDKLVIRQSGTTYFQDETEQRQKINYGIHMHAVLSRVKYAEEIESTLDDIILSGLATENDRVEIMNQLQELMLIPQVSYWFNKEWTVRTEVPVLLPDGAENRIDRLITKDKKAIVIDFKTGAPKKTDHEQVLEYMTIMRQMNFFEVEGFLLYLKNNEVVQVKEGGKQKAIRKQKDKDQLGLGF